MLPHSKRVLRQNSRHNTQQNGSNKHQIKNTAGATTTTTIATKTTTTSALHQLQLQQQHHHHSNNGSGGQLNYNIASSHYKQKMSAHSHADPISLSFNDVALRMSDVQLLMGPHWLNDQLLSFYYEYLEHSKYKNNADLLFISPEVTQCMKFMDDHDLEALLSTLKAARKPFIFFILNDHECKESAGGSHWSLLVLSRPEKTFFHFDSYGNNNTTASQDFMKRVKDFLGVRQAKFRPTRCLQQANGYDCGIHVICMTDSIADYVNRYESIDGLPQLHIDTIKAKRTELLKLIQTLGGKT